MPTPVTTIQSKALIFMKDDLDTDQIIPARFLKGTTRTGLGQYMFYDWRYDEQGQVKIDSLFDSAQIKGRQILVAGNNFGCGSSREHAPWALKDYGIQAILAPSFADIFYNNSLKNQLLPVALPAAVIAELKTTLEENPEAEISIDLNQQQVLLPNQKMVQFEINGFRKQCLLEGLDDVAFVLKHLPKIEAFEAVLP